MVLSISGEVYSSITNAVAVQNLTATTQHCDVSFSTAIRHFWITEMCNVSISESVEHVRYHVQEDGGEKQPVASKQL